MSHIRRKSLIPRFDLPMTTRTIVVGVASQSNPFADATTSYTFVRGAASACTVQATSGYEVSLMSEGDRSEEMYTIFSNTPLHPSISNTKSLADAIYIPAPFWGISGSGGWFKVIKCKPRLNGIINHYEIICSRDYNLISTDGFAQYPSITSLDTIITTKDKLLDSTLWLPTWTGENT